MRGVLLAFWCVCTKHFIVSCLHVQQPWQSPPLLLSKLSGSWNTSSPVVSVLTPTLNPNCCNASMCFCKQCLERLVVRDHQGLSLQCPSCRRSTLLPPTSVSGLQTAFYLNNLFEVRDTLEKVKEPQKTQCEKCKKCVAINFCRNCGKLICARCTETHQEWLSSHEVITLDQLEGDVAQLVPPKRKVMFCSKHPTKELDLYCETCEELICRDCTVRIHREHQYDLVADAFEKHKDVLVASVQPVQRQLDTVTNSLQQLDTQCQHITDQREALLVNIHKNHSTAAGSTGGKEDRAHWPARPNHSAEAQNPSCPERSKLS